VDPVDQTLWLATPSGWISFQPDLRLWARGTVPGRVRTIAFDRQNPVAGLYLLTGSGWYNIPRGAPVAERSAAPVVPVTPVTPEQAIRRNPTLQSNRAAILQSPGMRIGQYTAAAEAFNQQGWYIGTSEGGLLFLQQGAALPERMAFGLGGPVASSLHATRDGVWVASNATGSSPAMLTMVRDDLRAFTMLSGSPAFGLRFARTARLTAHQQDLWVASDIGAVRVPLDGRSVEVFDLTRGLPDNQVFAIAAYRGDLLVGTFRGVARIDDSLHVRPVAPAFGGRAWAVAASADTVWIGTDLGIRYALRDVPGLFQPAGLGESPSFRVPVYDLAWKADTLVGMSRDELFWRDPATGAWARSPNLSGVLGQLHRLALHRDGFWVAGDRGVGFATVDRSVLSFLSLGDDLPGIPLDLAVQGDYLWVATDVGVVRWRLDAIAP
jgi:ligand-binding sensor domain-containing protein